MNGKSLSVYAESPHSYTEHRNKALQFWFKSDSQLREREAEDYLNGRLHKVLKRNNFKKSYRFTEILGCSLEEFKLYFESKIIKGSNDRNNNIDRKEKDWNLDKGRAVI